MEFVLFLSNTILVAGALYWCLLNSARKPGTPVFGFFVWRNEKLPPSAERMAERKLHPGRWEGRK